MCVSVGKNMDGRRCTVIGKFFSNFRTVKTGSKRLRGGVYRKSSSGKREDTTLKEVYHGISVRLGVGKKGDCDTRARTFRNIFLIIFIFIIEIERIKRAKVEEQMP